MIHFLNSLLQSNHRLMFVCGAIRRLRQGRSKERASSRVAIAICTWNAWEKEGGREREREMALMRQKEASLRDALLREEKIWSDRSHRVVRVISRRCAWRKNKSFARNTSDASTLSGGSESSLGIKHWACRFYRLQMFLCTT